MLRAKCIIKSVISGGERLAVKTRIFICFFAFAWRALARTCYAEMSGRAPPTKNTCSQRVSLAHEIESDADKALRLKKHALICQWCNLLWCVLMNKQTKRQKRASIRVHSSDANWFGNW
jgi:hypothetical protein